MVLTSHYSHLIIQSPSLLKFLWTGVDLFFVISGFVFGPVAFAGAAPLVPYAIRRFFRIYPLYLFSLLLYYLATPSDPDKQGYFIKHLFFLGTTSSPREAFFFNPAYWSLPAEVEYYLLLPLFVLIIARHTAGLWAFLGLSLLLRFAISAGATSFSIPEPNTLAILKMHLPGVLAEFLVGLALYWAYQRFREVTGRGWPIAALTAGALLWLSLGLFFVEYGDQGIRASIWLSAYFSFLCAVSYGLMLYGLLMMVRCGTPYCLGLAAFLGNLSFGVYLFHILILRIYQDSGMNIPGPAAYLLCAAAVLVLSVFAHYLVERPMRDFGRGLARTYAPASAAAQGTPPNP